MSKIQDLLAAQRSKANGSTDQKPIGNSSVPETQNVSQEIRKDDIRERPQTLQEKLRKKPIGNGLGSDGTAAPVVEQGFIENVHDDRRNEKISLSSLNEGGSSSNIAPSNNDNLQHISKPENGNSNNQSSAETKEEIMPSGLSLLAQMKWKKEHASKNAGQILSNSVATAVEKSPRQEETPSSTELRPEQEKSGLVVQSASQQADALKTNDGLANIEELRINLKYLADNIENKDVVSNVIRTIGLQLKNSPELTPHMTHADVNLVVRGARSAYSLAAMAKQNKEDNKKSKTKGMAEVDQIFKDGGIDFSGLKFN